MWICVGLRDPPTKPSRSWLRVVVSKPQLILAGAETTTNKVTTKTRAYWRGCGVAVLKTVPIAQELLMCVLVRQLFSLMMGEFPQLPTEGKAQQVRRRRESHDFVHVGRQNACANKGLFLLSREMTKEDSATLKRER